MSAYDFDYLVIGAGSGGVRSARIAAGHGAKVAIAEGARPGGTCVNIGCVPKKLFAYAADFHAAFEDSRGFGWNAGKPGFDWPTLLRNKDREIERLNGIYRDILGKAGVEYLEGFARFTGPHTVNVGDREYSAEKILIATGGVPRRPDFPGTEHVRISDEMFYLDALPRRAVIQGGGYIAVEFAHILHGIGVEVTLLYRGELFLRGFDDDIRSFLAEEMRTQGIDLRFNSDIAQVDKTGDGYTVTLDDKETLDCDLVFSAIGRDPNTQNLNLSAAGVQTGTKGEIPVDSEERTNIPHIFAVGDVTDRVNLTPVAIAEGHALADRLFGKAPGRQAPDYALVPSAVFSAPPIGTVGLSEAQARAEEKDIAVYKTAFRPLKHTLSGRAEKTFMKLVVDRTTDRVLGVHMCGADAPEILQGFAVALTAGATKAHFDRTIGIHPTSAEEFVTMK